MTAQTPIVNAGLKYVNGLDLVRTGNSTITMAAGAARDSGNVNDIVLSSTATIDGSTVGANGVDLAVLVASKFYAVYVIGDSTGYNAAAGLLSLSFSAPSLPDGYDMYRRVGWVLTDGSAHILQFWQYGNGQVRSYYYDVGISALSGGTSTSYANIDLSASVPPIVTEVLLNVAYTANSATNVAHFLPYGSSATNGVVQFGYGVAAAQVGMATVPSELNSGKPEVQYKVAASDSLTLLTQGFKDYLT